MQKWLLLLLLSCISMPSIGQTHIGIGAQADFPMMFNKYIGGYHHHSGAPGLRLALSHTAREGSFSPAATISISPAALPVQSIPGAFTVSMNFTHLQGMIYGRLRKEVKKGDLFYGIGIGLSSFWGTGITAGGGNNIELRNTLSDSTQFIKTIAPVVAFNLEYIRELLPQKQIYFGIGTQLQYLYFFDEKSTYRIDIIDSKGNYYKAEPKLFGHTLNPMVFINLYYRFGTSSRY